MQDQEYQATDKNSRTELGFEEEADSLEEQVDSGDFDWKGAF